MLAGRDRRRHLAAANLKIEKLSGAREGRTVMKAALWSSRVWASTRAARREIQAGLQAGGFDPGGADGLFGQPHATIRSAAGVIGRGQIAAHVASEAAYHGPLDWPVSDRVSDGSDVVRRRGSCRG